MKHLPAKEIKHLLQTTPTLFSKASNVLAMDKGPSEQAKYRHEWASVWQVLLFSLHLRRDT